MQRFNTAAAHQVRPVVPVTALPAPDVRTDEQVHTFALQWFAQMRAGEIDRTHLSADYDAHLTVDGVRAMSDYLQACDFGVEPIGAHIMQRRTSGEQSFYLLKLLFPRGDAASLLFGFDLAGKITGVSLMSMAGD